ncbi:UNVERIFIED_ORG: hypothetical protein J2740_004627 [Rhizobium nepotum]|nr:hypothetical protein [Rhizobium nepotum]
MIGNPLARQFIERTAAIRGLVVGCMLLTSGELGFLSAVGFWGLAASIGVFTIGEIPFLPCEYNAVEGIWHDRSRGSYFGARSFSTIVNLKDRR